MFKYLFSIVVVLVFSISAFAEDLIQIDGLVIEPIYHYMTNGENHFVLDEVEVFDDFQDDPVGKERQYNVAITTSPYMVLEKDDGGDIIMQLDVISASTIPGTDGKIFVATSFDGTNKRFVTNTYLSENYYLAKLRLDLINNDEIVIE